MLLRISSGIRSRGEHDVFRAMLPAWKVSISDCCERWVWGWGYLYIVLVATSLGAVKGILFLAVTAAVFSSLFRLVIDADIDEVAVKWSPSARLKKWADI